MASGCPVQIQFAYDVDELKFKITSLNLEHQNHPISEEHVKTSTFDCRHMPPEALTFAKDSLASGAQPTKVRMMLQEKFGTHLISKDILHRFKREVRRRMEGHREVSRSSSQR